MKLFHTSDWHVDQLNGWGRKGLFQNYHLDKIHEMVTHAIAEKVDVFIFAGDLYKNSSSNFKIKDKINQILINEINRLIEAGIKVILESGNHDIKWKNLANKDNNLALFNTIEYKDLFVNKPEANEIEYRDYSFGEEKLRVILFPYLKGREKNEVKTEITKLVESSEDKCIIIGHLDVFGATYGSIEIQGLDIKSVNVWTPKELESLGSDLVLLGHVHNHQVLGKNKKVIYCGSPYKLSYNEEGSVKGYYLHQLEKEKVLSQFVDLKDRGWKTFRYNYKKNKESYLNLLKEIKDSNIKDNIVRVVLEGIEPKDHKYIPSKEIKDLLEDKEVMLFRGFTYKTDKSKIEKKGRDEAYGEEISLEKLDPKQIFNSILKKDNETQEFINESNILFDEITDELEV